MKLPQFLLLMLPKKRVLFFSAFILIGSFVYAVPGDINCSQSLRLAEKKFESGNLREIPGLLEPCLKNGFTKEEQLAASRLLSLAYLYLDDLENAELSFLYLLKNYPDYQPNPAMEPIELIKLYESYRTLPIYSYGFHGGINTSQMSLIKDYGVDNALQVTESYHWLPGFSGGIKIEFPISKKVFFATEPNYQLLRYKYSRQLNTTTMVDEDSNPYNYAVVNFKENQSWVNLPVILGLSIGKNKLGHYLLGGASVGYLITSNAEASRKLAFSSLKTNEITGPDINITELRNKVNYWAMVGTGIKIKRKLNYVSIEARYNIGLFNIVNASKRYQISQLWNNYGYLDNDVKQNYLEIKGAYLITKYQPRKIVK